MSGMEFPLQQTHLALHTEAPKPGEATEASGPGYRRQPLETQGSAAAFDMPPLDPKRVYRGIWTAENGGTLLASADTGEDLTVDGIVITIP